MGIWMFLRLVCLTALLGSFGWPAAGAAEERRPGKDIREPVLAGTWYPGNPDALRRMIQGYLSGVKTQNVEGDLSAIVVPHAGYRYSGQVAAYAYRLLEGKGFRRIVMIGPSHRVGFKGVSVDTQAGYKTPLGIVPVDQDFAKALLKTGPQIRAVPQAHVEEHSLEIQVPFLQAVLKDFQIVPILMGDQDFKTCSDLAGNLVKALDKHQKTLILASTDLSHRHSGARAKELDMEFLKHVRQLDPQGLANSISSGLCEACGAGPTIATMLAARALGAGRTVILHYANSGDINGDYSEVVGYLSAALTTGK